jgi:putative addiction module component (TIGR02574 family)
LVAAISKAELLKLEVAERLELIEELWEHRRGSPSDLVPLTDDERALLDARLQDHRANPGAASPWAEILNQR